MSLLETIRQISLSDNIQASKEQITIIELRLCETKSPEEIATLEKTLQGARESLSSFELIAELEAEDLARERKADPPAPPSPPPASIRTPPEIQSKIQQKKLERWGRHKDAILTRHEDRIEKLEKEVSEMRQQLKYLWRVAPHVDLDILDAYAEGSVEKDD